MHSEKLVCFFAGFYLLLCIVPAADASWPPPAKNLEPPPECGPEKDRCEFTLISNYRLTMAIHRPGSAPQWAPVAPRPDGLWIKGEVTDCGLFHRKLGPEESRHVVTGDGNPKMIFSVNGSMPGPPLVVYEGQQVIVHYINRLENEATTLHFHGMHQRGTPWMDGTMMSQCPVAPGETFTYRFKADPRGTYWYHSHLGSTFTMGIQGAFIVLPNPNKPGYRPREDIPPMSGDFPVMVSDFWKEPSGEISLYRRYKIGRYGYGLLNDICYNVTLMADTTICAHWPFNSIIVNGKGRHYAYDGFRPNNPLLPLEVFQVRKGEYFYFRLICPSYELTMAVSIDKHPLHVVATDGSDIVTTTVDIINIAPGERYDFYIDATDPDGTGLYWMRILTMEQLRGDWIPMAPHHGAAIIRYDGAPEGKDPTSQRREYSPETPGLSLNCPFQDYGPAYMIRCVNLDALRLLEPDYSTWNVDPSEVVDVFIQNQGTIIPGGHGRVPTYNGIMNEWPAYPVQIYKHTISEYLNNCSKCEFPDDPTMGCLCTHLIKIPLGKVVNLVVTNNNLIEIRGTMPHPTHIHGHTPQVAKLAWGEYDDKMRMIGVNQDTYCESPICFNGTRWADPSWNGDNIPGMMGPYSVKKDSIFVGSGSYVVWRFRADNPGFWLLHCHVEYHISDGMGLIMQVGEPEDMPDHPEGMDRCGDFHTPEEDYYRGINFLNNNNKPASSSTAPQPNPAVVPPPPQAVPAAQPPPPVTAVPAAPAAPVCGPDVALGFIQLSLQSFEVITVVLSVLCCLLAAGLLLQHWRHSEKNRSSSGYDLVPEKRPLMEHH